MEVAVIADEEDQGVFVDALVLEALNDPAHRVVHLGDQSEVVDHVLLVALGGVEPPVEADAALIARLRQERRQGVQVGCIQWRPWYVVTKSKSSGRARPTPYFPTKPVQ